MNDKDMGIFLRSNQTFYYMVNGYNHTPSNSVERILKTLMMKDLITFRQESGEDQMYRQYEVVSIRDARDRKLKMEAIHTNAHVRKVVSERIGNIPEENIGWGSRVS